LYKREKLTFRSSWRGFQISLAQDVFFLHPAPVGVPTYDEFINGTVTLWLPKPRTLKHFTVRLRGLFDIGWNDATPYESGICLEKTVSLFEEGNEVTLEKGEHTFEFILIVPSFAACQFFPLAQRSFALADVFPEL
jgi:hypothetical protein